MSRLELCDLSLQVHLGCTVAERAVLQEISVSVEIVFTQTPKACFTDDLKDTVCVFELSQLLRELSAVKEFQTIEALTATALSEIHEKFPLAANAKVKVHKLKPPIVGLEGGSRFELRSGDLDSRDAGVA